MEASIRIDGLAQFTRAVKKLDNELPKMVRIAMNDAAGIVVEYGQARVPRRSGRAYSSIKARSTRTFVRVVEGGSRAPHAPWLDFGGRVGRRHSVARPFIKEGRYLYPALRERNKEIREALENSLTRVARSAGLELD